MRGKIKVLSPVSRGSPRELKSPWTEVRASPCGEFPGKMRGDWSAQLRGRSGEKCLSSAFQLDQVIYTSRREGIDIVRDLFSKPVIFWEIIKLAPLNFMLNPPAHVGPWIIANLNLSI